MANLSPDAVWVVTNNSDDTASIEIVADLDSIGTIIEISP